MFKLVSCSFRMCTVCISCFCYAVQYLNRQLHSTNLTEHLAGLAMLHFHCNSLRSAFNSNYRRSRGGRCSPDRLGRVAASASSASLVGAFDIKSRNQIATHHSLRPLSRSPFQGIVLKILHFKKQSFQIINPFFSSHGYKETLFVLLLLFLIVLCFFF